MISTSLQLLADVADGLWFPKSASTFSAQVDSTFMLVLWIVIFFFVPITFALVYFTIRFHKSKGQPAESQVSHNTPLEIAWSVLPSFLLVWIFVKGAIGFIDQRAAPAGSDVVNCKAQKWSWSFDYGNGVFHPELHILQDQPTKLVMRSEDVIHSLFIPVFRAKQDVVPGRYHEMWFEPTVASERVSEEVLEAALEKARAEGDGQIDQLKWIKQHPFTTEGYSFFDLYCTEYCGTDHSVMQTVVVVHETREDLDAWIEENSKRPDDVTPAEWGRLLYERRGCASCHSLDGSKRVGPSFAGGYGAERKFTDGSSGIVDENYLRESIVDPKALIVEGYNPVMPSFRGQFSEEDLDSLIAFLRTLADDQP